jgi:hypothetical protein
MSETNSLAPELQAALLDIIKQETSAEATQARSMILRRLALEGDVVPSRIPAPINITQIGGYANLLEKRGYDELGYRMMASTLGLPADNFENALYDISPVQFFVNLEGDRPDCEQTQSFPLSFAMRSDFHPAFATAQQEMRQAGAAVPFMNIRRALPGLNDPLPNLSQTFDIIGRALEIPPNAALHELKKDPVIIVKETDGRGGLYALADDTVTVSGHDAYVIDTESGGLTTAPLTGNYLNLSPILNKAGWYSGYDIDTHPLLLLKLRNITGLIPGVTTFGEELSLLYTRQQIVASSVREMLNWVWTGMAFVKV